MLLKTVITISKYQVVHMYRILCHKTSIVDNLENKSDMKIYKPNRYQHTNYY